MGQRSSIKRSLRRPSSRRVRWRLLKGRRLACTILSKALGQDFVQLPHVLANPQEFGKNLLHLGKSLRDLLRDQDYNALYKFDPDLYQLANPAVCDHLTDWEKGRLVARVALRYGAIVGGNTIKTAELAAKIGARVAGKLRTLVQGAAKDLEKEAPKRGGGAP